MKPFGWRDRAVVWLANKVLKLASKRYRLLTQGLYMYGMDAAAHDYRQGRPAPPSWRENRTPDVS